MKKIILFLTISLLSAGPLWADGHAEELKKIFQEAEPAFAAQEYDRVIELMQKAITLIPDGDPELPSVYSSLAMAYFAKKELDKCVDVLKKSIVLNPQNLTAYQILTTAYIYRKEYHAALEAALVALQMDPQHPGHHANLAIIYDDLGLTEGYTKELVLRELYHLQKENELDVNNSLPDDPDFSQKMERLVSLEKRFTITNAREQVILIGPDEQVSERIAAERIAQPEKFTLPKDIISDTEKEEYLKKAQN